MICRTPFQAVMLKKIVELENANIYDLVYLTQDDAEEDRHYYNELAINARQSQYLYVKKQRFDILNHCFMYWRIKRQMKRQSYDLVLISSFDNLACQKLALNNKKAKIVSFDDGTGHINTNSIYLVGRAGYRAKLYEWAFGVSSMGDFLPQISHHYSAYPKFKHVMPREIVRYIDPFSFPKLTHQKDQKLCFFIGQPYHEYLSKEDLAAYQRFIQKQNIDFYVKHPRESTPLIMDLPFLPKNGKIAEEAIFSTCQGKRPVIYGGFSSVLMNINPSQADKIMLLRNNVPEDAYYAELGQQAGCQIIYL